MTDSPAASLAVSNLAARGAAGAAAAAVVALILLHVLRPDLEPSRTMISQYALGPHGWIMGLCFFAFALASALLLVSLVGSARGVFGWLGLIALAAATVGLAMGGGFPMDPAATAPEHMSFAGRMHGVAFMVGVPGQVLAMLLMSLALRGQPEWGGLPLLWATAATWISLGIMAWALMGFMKDTDAPTVMGYFNRLLMLGYAAWIVLAAWPRVRF